MVHFFRKSDQEFSKSAIFMVFIAIDMKTTLNLIFEMFCMKTSVIRLRIGVLILRGVSKSGFLRRVVHLHKYRYTFLSHLRNVIHQIHPFFQISKKLCVLNNEYRTRISIISQSTKKIKNIRRNNNIKFWNNIQKYLDTVKIHYLNIDSWNPRILSYFLFEKIRKFRVESLNFENVFWLRTRRKTDFQLRSH